MTKDKTTIIRALERAIERLPEQPGNGGMGTSDDHARSEGQTYGYETRQMLVDALASLSEAGPSDEEIERIAYEQYPVGPKGSAFGRHKRLGFEHGLRYARAHFPSPVPTSEPVAYTTQLALDCSKTLAGTPHGIIDACAVNIWGDKGIPLHVHPAQPKAVPIIDAAIEVFDLGPEHEDEVLRFGMKVQDLLNPSQSQHR